MSTTNERMLDPGKEPDALSVSGWIGPRSYQHWLHILRFIETTYPGVFRAEWLYGGKKYGWALRFKKSKSFCNLIPEKNRFKILLVFGAKERKQVEPLLPELVSHFPDDYANATTYHDGRWVASVVDSKKVLSDVEKLMALKRRPKSTASHYEKRRVT